MDEEGKEQLMARCVESFDTIITCCHLLGHCCSEKNNLNIIVSCFDIRTITFRDGDKVQEGKTTTIKPF